MTPQDAFMTYMAVKSHFGTKGYDFFKYNGRVKMPKGTFAKRADAGAFEWVSREYGDRESLMGFFVSNFLKNPKLYIRDCRNSECKKTYNLWLGRLDGLTYVFKKDMTKIIEHAEKKKLKAKALFRMPEDGSLPPVLNMAMAGDIEPETYVILDRLMKLGKYYDTRAAINPLYKEFAFRMKKYGSFVQIDEEEFAEITRTFFTPIS